MFPCCKGVSSATDPSEQEGEVQKRIGKKPREVPPFPAESVMNLSG